MSIRIGDRIISGGGGNGESLTNQNLSSEITQVYNWVGTYAEYTEQDISNTHPDWVCYITDDEFGDEQEYEIIQYTARNVGDIFFTSRTDINLNGAVECNGNTYSLSDYDGEESIKALFESNRLPYVSMSEYDSQLLENDSVGVFGWDGGENTLFRVPTLRDMFLEAGRASELGEYIEAGLPNITGSVSAARQKYDAFPDVKTGAFVGSTINGQNAGFSADRNNTGEILINFDASSSSSVYGNSDTVQPKAIKYRAMIQLSTGVLDESLYKIENHALFDDRITNCITYIPQDIKLELNNGTLTLKAGSKVYVPNGFETDGTTRKFDVVAIASDLTIDGESGGFSGTGTLYYNSESALSWYSSGVDASGTTPPSTSNFYNTSTNTIYRYHNSVQGVGLSFPLAHIIVTSDVITSIDQVFNGFGYIGDEFYVLPGVKCLMPDGRNEDGSLKNIEFTTTRVDVCHDNDRNDPMVLSHYHKPFFLQSDGYLTYTNWYWQQKDKPTFSDSSDSTNRELNYWYNTETNQIWKHRSGVTEIRQCACVGQYLMSSNGITNFRSKQNIQVLDYNDKEYIAHQAMPSGLYEDLTLGASGTLYVAPADGYVFVDKTATAQGQYLQINFHGMISSQLAIGNGNHVRTLAPVSMGTRFGVSYNVDGTTNFFRFVYAQGAK